MGERLPIPSDPWGMDGSSVNPASGDRVVGLEVSHHEEPPPSSCRRVLRRSTEVRLSPALFLSDLLGRIERSGTSTYSMLFEAGDERRLGEILISNREICLVALQDGGTSLGTRLLQRDPGVAEAAREALGRARAEGRPLADALAALGSATSERIRGALLELIAEGLSAIACAAPRGLIETCLSASQRRVSSILSAFPVEEVYWRAVAQLAPPGGCAAARCYAELAELAASAVLVAPSEGEPVPIAARGLPSLSIAEILQLGRAVEQTACSPALLAAGLSPRLTLVKSSSDAILCVTSADRIALLTGLDTVAQARALGRARQLLDLDPASSEA